MCVNRIKLKKLTNTRDLGGMAAADGRVIRTGKLIRSGKLFKLPPRTASALCRYGVTTVVDLRIEGERRAGPDTKIDGCRYVHLPMLCYPGTSDETLFQANERESARAKRQGRRIKREFDGADSYMIETYRSILFDKGAQVVLAKFLRLVRDEEGCILWHCASGKDRAGLCAMLVESLLGVDEETILADYMLSGKYWRTRYFFIRVGIYAVPFSLDLKRILLGLMRIKKEYLLTVMEELKARYGSIIGYCKAELGVTDEDIKKMREKYLV